MVGRIAHQPPALFSPAIYDRYLEDIEEAMLSQLCLFFYHLLIGIRQQNIKRFFAYKLLFTVAGDIAENVVDADYEIVHIHLHEPQVHVGNDVAVFIYLYAYCFGVFLFRGNIVIHPQVALVYFVCKYGDIIALYNAAIDAAKLVSKYGRLTFQQIIDTGNITFWLFKKVFIVFSSVFVVGTYKCVRWQGNMEHIAEHPVCQDDLLIFIFIQYTCLNMVY